jgi:hypothetical protein
MDVDEVAEEQSTEQAGEFPIHSVDMQYWGVAVC